MKELATYSDEQLVSLLQQNDEPSFATIYDRYWKPLYISARQVLQERHTAEDAVQEVFISLWKRRREVQIASLKSYLYQATRFQVLKAIRAERAGKDFFTRLAFVSKQIERDDPLLFKELGGLLQYAFATLPADEQEIFRLHREEGLTYKQIAEEKAISVKTVEKKMSRALKQLRHGLDEALLIVLISQLLK
jgi:RNA polymerase sigma-70 factor (ECF subfamily)